MMRKLLLTVAVLSVVAIATGTTAQAHITASQKLRKSQTVVAWYEGKGHWHLRPGFHTCSQIKFDRPAARCWKHRLGYSFHKRRIERLRPKPKFQLSHQAGWLCIHSREGAWNADTGNGYYGGLQMTYGWGSIEGKASGYSAMEQMAAAEGGYYLSGYSRAWLAGQWPNTYPPCAHLFR